MAKSNLVGRPPKFSSKEEIQEKIDEYFKNCDGEILRNADGEVEVNKYGEPIVINRRPYTVTGLALALGFSSRQALLNYQAKKEFNDTITRAKARVEQYTEERLFDRDGTSGAQFSLKNNFNGWNRDKETDEDTVEKALEKIGQIFNGIENVIE